MKDATLEITVPAGNVGDLARLFELERLGFLPDGSIEFHDGAYSVLLSGAHVAYVLETWGFACESRNAESVQEWAARRLDQLPLALESGAVRF